MDGAQDKAELRRELYGRVCDSYHAVDDFRMKLLGLLPVATGGGVFILLSANAELIGAGDTDFRASLAAIGAFGVLFTLGLFSFELFGIKKCHYLIRAGQHLERELDIRGQFRSRPSDLARVINEPFASGIIYPGCMAAWLFLAFASVSGTWAAVVATAVLLVGATGTLLGVRAMATNEARETCVLKLVEDAANSGIDREELLERAASSWKPTESAKRPRPKGQWVDVAVQRLRLQGEIEVQNGTVHITHTAPK